MLEVTGKPSKEDVASIQSPQAGAIIDSLKIMKHKNLKDMCPTLCAEGLDLMKKLLQFNPSKRPNVEQTLKHPYVAQFHSEDEEFKYKKIIEIPLDDHKYTIKEYREKLYADIRKKRKEQRKEYVLQHQAKYVKPK